MTRSAALIAVLALATAAAPAPIPEPSFAPTPQQVLGLIRARFRSHRPPPPFVTYAISRAQKTDRGFIDEVNTYTYHVWCRNLDRAALARQIYRLGAIGELEFQRPAFNEDRDPGPPTADIFAPAPLKKTTVFDVPTPEPIASEFPVIGRTRVAGDYDYHVDSLETEGPLLHLKVTPLRDPERNTLREVYAQKTTYEVTRLITHDRLFDEGDKKIYNVTFDMNLVLLQGTPVVTSIHGLVGSTADGADYTGDGKVVDFTFKDIKFPKTLPEWYFDPRSYARHRNDAPV